MSDTCVPPEPSTRVLWWAGSVEDLLVDPHQGPGLVGFALVLDVAELVPELAVLPLVVVVVLGLPDRLERSRLVELQGEQRTRSRPPGTPPGSC